MRHGRLETELEWLLPGRHQSDIGRVTIGVSAKAAGVHAVILSGISLSRTPESMGLACLALPLLKIAPVRGMSWVFIALIISLPSPVIPWTMALVSFRWAMIYPVAGSLAAEKYIIILESISLDR